MCDQYGVLRAQLSLGKFGGRFLLELCCVRIGGNSCIPLGDIFGREVSRGIGKHGIKIKWEHSLLMAMWYKRRCIYDKGLWIDAIPCTCHFISSLLLLLLQSESSLSSDSISHCWRNRSYLCFLYPNFRYSNTNNISFIEFEIFRQMYGTPKGKRELCDGLKRMWRERGATWAGTRDK